MSRSKRQTETESAESDIGEQVEDLAEAVRSLTDQVEVLRNVLDELKSAIRWGLQNDKFRSPENPPIEPVEIDH